MQYNSLQNICQTWYCLKLETETYFKSNFQKENDRIKSVYEYYYTSMLNYLNFDCLMHQILRQHIRVDIAELLSIGFFIDSIVDSSYMVHL